MFEDEVSFVDIEFLGIINSLHLAHGLEVLEKVKREAKVLVHG